MNLQQQNGSVAGKRRGGYRRSVLEGHDERLRRWMEKEPGLTLAQLASASASNCTRAWAPRRCGTGWSGWA